MLQQARVSDATPWQNLLRRLHAQIERPLQKQ